jgi:hypothetical protein
MSFTTPQKPSIRCYPSIAIVVLFLNVLLMHSIYVIPHSARFPQNFPIVADKNPQLQFVSPKYPNESKHSIPRAPDCDIHSPMTPFPNIPQCFDHQNICFPMICFPMSKFTKLLWLSQTFSSNCFASDPPFAKS